MDALNQVGVPGTIDTYRVDFRVPESAALGTTSLQLRAAWIAGNSVNLTVRYHGVTANGDEMKRRIEITRESSRRIRLQSSGPLRCAGCGSPPELVTVAEAARLIGAPLSTLEAAIEFRRLQVWPADVVCLHCVRKFRKENK